MQSAGRSSCRDGKNEACILNFGFHPKVDFMAEVADRERKRQARVLRALRSIIPAISTSSAQRPEIRLDKLENDSPDPVMTPIIAAAHAYQVQLGARRTAGEVSRQQGPAGARAEPPDRLDRRRRLRHRQRQGLHRRGRAGGQPDRRQRRRGRRARARHGADAVEADHPDQPRAAQRHDARPQRLHGQRHQQPDHRHRRARQCRPPRRQAVHARCST